MAYRVKQKFLNRGISYDRETLKEMFNGLSHQENANENTPIFHLIPVKMAMIMLERMQRKRNTPPLRIEMQTSHFGNQFGSF